MKLIEIVVHACAVELPLYAAMLRYQIRAIADNPPQHCRAKLIVACLAFDEDRAVADATHGKLGLCETFDLERVIMSREQLFRRSIFRHAISQCSSADVLWFADADWVMGPGCLDAVAAQVSREDGLCLPTHYHCRKSPEEGDEDWQAVLNGAEPVIDTSKFHRRRSKIAIGGLQIIGSDFARRIGYLPDSKWQWPADPTKPFRCFRDDSKWRMVHFSGANRGKLIDVPNLYRLRHSKSSLNIDK